MSHPEFPDSIAKHGVHRSQMNVNVNQSPNSAQYFQSELFHRSNISLNDSGVGISPLTPRTTVFTFDAIEIEQHIRESMSSVSERDDENDNGDDEEPELARIVNSFASISSNPSESERIRPTAPLNCLQKSDNDNSHDDNDAHNDDDDDGDNGDDADNNYNNNGDDNQDNTLNDNHEDDDEDDDVFLNDLESLNIDEEQQRINNYLLARINRVEHHLSIQYHRRNADGYNGNGTGTRSNLFRSRLGGLQLRCQRFVKRILGIAMPNNSQACSPLTPFGIEREFIQRMTFNAANNENDDETVQESVHNSRASPSSHTLPDVVPDSAVMAREIMRNMARKERRQRNSCHRSASFAAPSSTASVEHQSIDSRRTMSVSFPIETRCLTAVARQLREISCDFQAKNQMRPFSSFSSLYPVFDLLANTFIETTRCVSRVTRRRTFAARSNRHPSPESSFEYHSRPNMSRSNVQSPTASSSLRDSSSLKAAPQPSSSTSTTAPKSSSSASRNLQPPRPPTPQLQPSTVTVPSSSITAITSRGRVVNNSRFYTTITVSNESANSSSQLAAKCFEENNNEY